VIRDDIEFKTFFMLLYYMGVRKGEAMALYPEDIDFNSHEINIYKTVVEKHKKG
jgi:integrase